MKSKTISLCCCGGSAAWRYQGVGRWVYLQCNKCKWDTRPKPPGRMGAAVREWNRTMRRFNRYEIQAPDKDYTAAIIELDREIG